jgi:hypothetical protein
MSTATLNPPVAVKPQVVITWRSRAQRKADRAARKAARHSIAATTILPEDTMPVRVRKRVRLAGQTIAAIFAKVTHKIWSFLPVRIVTIGAAAILGVVFANLLITIISLFIALPFYAAEMYLAGDIIFLSAAAVCWWGAIYYGTGYMVEKGWL